MAYMSTHTNILSKSLEPEQMALIKRFDHAKKLPKLLISNNDALMQKAFLSVPQNTWMERLIDLHTALKANKGKEATGHFLVTMRSSGQLPHIDKLLDQVFLQKYVELRDKVSMDYDGFFPYRISRANQNLIIFEKLESSDLIAYVLSNPV